jgi:hypothetical protein
MAALADFHNRVCPVIPSCPIPTVDQAILDACIEFCEQGSALYKELAATVTVIGDPEVQLTLPTETKLVRIAALKVDQREIEAREYFEIETDVQGLPRVFSASQDALVQMYPVPDKVYPVKAMAILKPSRAATAVDDLLLESWADSIAAGALYRLLMLPAAAWVNPVAAKVYFDTFRVSINRSEIEFRRGRTNREMRVQSVWV